MGLSSLSSRQQALLGVFILLFGGQLLYGANAVAAEAGGTTYVTVTEVDEGEYVSGELRSYTSLTPEQKQQFIAALHDRAKLGDPALPNTVIERDGKLYEVSYQTEWEHDRLILLARLLGLAGLTTVLGALVIIADASEAWNP